MNLNDIEGKLNELFSQEDIRLILWVDENKEFVEDVKSMNIDGELLFLDNSPVVKTKYLLSSDDNNYLIYSNNPLSSLENNFLADIFSYAYKFSADKISIIIEDLNIPPEFRSAVEKYSMFFNAKSRVDKFKSLNVSVVSDKSILVGVLAVCVKESSVKFENILRKILCEGFEDNKYLDLLDKYDLLDAFWALVSEEYGFEDNKPSLFKLFSSMLVSYTYNSFNGDFPKTLEQYILSSKENNVYVFLDNFMKNVDYRDTFDELSQELSVKLSLDNVFRNNLVDDFINCDAFILFDKRIFKHYVELLYYNKQELQLNLSETRINTHYYRLYKNHYLLVDYANKFMGCINRFMDEKLPEDINKLITLFIEKYSVVDKFYRKFYYHYDKLNTEVKEFDKLEDLRILIEDMYSNTFLNELNIHFNKLLKDGTSLNDIDRTMQWKFYREVVRPSVSKHRTVVIISDAFRYGNAIELNNIMENDPTRKPELDAMISTVPSYTDLGMAALLPNNKIEYDGSNVLVDGMSTMGVINREKILKKHNPQAKAIKYDDIINMKRQEMNAFFKDSNLVYVYHNQVDARGDKASTENEVFDAVEESIKEINDLITKITNTRKCEHFYITADHGFIYKRDKLQEYSKVNLDEYNQEELIYKNRRFLLTNKETELSDSYCMSMDYIDIKDVFVTVPMGVNVFKVKGGGMNFVHGGASLEEIIIPLLYVSTTTGKSKMQKQVVLDLKDAKRKITSNTTRIEFVQRNNITENITPLVASVYFVDEDNNKISNENVIHADVSSDNPQDREFIKKFILQEKTYPKNKDYYLVIRDLEKDVEIERYNYILDIAFQDDFEFF